MYLCVRLSLFNSTMKLKNSTSIFVSSSPYWVLTRAVPQASSMVNVLPAWCTHCQQPETFHPVSACTIRSFTCNTNKSLEHQGRLMETLDLDRLRVSIPPSSISDLSVLQVESKNELLAIYLHKHFHRQIELEVSRALSMRYQTYSYQPQPEFVQLIYRTLFWDRLSLKLCRLCSTWVCSHGPETYVISYCI